MYMIPLKTIDLASLAIAIISFPLLQQVTQSITQYFSRICILRSSIAVNRRHILVNSTDHQSILLRSLFRHVPKQTTVCRFTKKKYGACGHNNEKWTRDWSQCQSTKCARSSNNEVYLDQGWVVCPPCKRAADDLIDYTGGARSAPRGSGSGHGRSASGASGARHRRLQSWLGSYGEMVRD